MCIRSPCVSVPNEGKLCSKQPLLNWGLFAHGSPKMSFAVMAGVAKLDCKRSPAGRKRVEQCCEETRKQLARVRLKGQKSRSDESNHKWARGACVSGRDVVCGGRSNDKTDL